MSLSLRASVGDSGVKAVRELAGIAKMPGNSVRTLAQVAALHTKFRQTGGAKGQFGFPLTRTVQLGDNSVARAYEAGEVRVTADGAELHVNEISWTVRFVGLECMRESSHDQSTGSDEPYVLWFVKSGGDVTNANRVEFEKINTGSKRVVDNKITSPANRLGLPFSIYAMVYEHDHGDRAGAQKVVNKAIKDLVGAYNEIADQVNNYNASTAAQKLPPPVNMPIIEGLIADVFGFADDFVGTGEAEVFLLPDESETPEQLAARIKPIKPVGKFNDQASYTHTIHVVGNPQGRYMLYFRVEMVKDEDPRPLGS
jgi:hypothetical protein